MDLDFLKSISEDQTDIMLMHPNFCGVYADHDNHPSPDLTTQLTTNSSNQINHGNYSIEDFNFINTSTSIDFMTSPTQTPSGDMQKRNSMAAMRDMIFRIAAMQPIHIDPQSVKPPKRRNVKISKDPQSVAARHRRERISERIRILQRLVPGGTKMDTASMLDEAILYMKFLKNQVQTLEKAGENRTLRPDGVGFPVPMSSGNYISMGTSVKGYQQQAQNVHHI